MTDEELLTLFRNVDVDIKALVFDLLEGLILPSELPHLLDGTAPKV